MNITNQQFLEAIFAEYYRAAHITGFAEDPGKLDQLGKRHYWGGTVWSKNPIENPYENNFFVISTFHVDPETGKNQRRKANFAGGFCIMIDDIGDGPGAKISEIDMSFIGPEPSWKLETSPGNCQYGYIFETPVLERGKIEALLKGLVALDLIDDGSDPGMLGCTRYARLPVGSNTKEKYGIAYEHRLITWNPGLRYGIDALAQSFGLALTDHTRDDQYPDPLPIENDLVYQSLERLGMIKSKLREGIWDITCPWQAQHTEELDNGSAYLSPMGYRCHHGHCGGKTGRDLLNWLHGQDPVYKQACEAKMVFEPVDNPVDNPVNIGDNLPVPEDEHDIEKAIGLIVPGDLQSTRRAYWALACKQTGMTPDEKDYYIRMIKDAAGVTMGVAKDQLRYTRAEVMADHRKKGILKEPAWTHYQEDKITACLENFEAMCEYHGITMQYNQMSHRIDLGVPGHNFDGEDLANRNLLHMRDLVQKYGLPYARVDEWMMGYAHKHAYHPFEVYLDGLSSLPFDPMCPMFDKLFRTLNIDEDERDNAEVFVRRWFISVVAAVRGHAGAGMKGVLTFAGNQGIGKTSWFREIFPEDMFCEGLVLDPHNKDTIIKATDHLVCELGELDATFRRDIPALKAFISSQYDQIRHPYAAKTSQHPRRTVFCATVNQTNFLVDDTGNSRFWPVEVLSCDFKEIKRMKESGHIALFWREIDEMYRACISGREEFKWWIGADEGSLLSESSEKFIRETAGEAMLADNFELDGPAVHWMTGAEIMLALGMRMNEHNYTTRKSEVLSTIRRITGQSTIKKFSRDGKRLTGYRMPQKKEQKMGASLAVVPSMVVEPEWL